MNEKLSAFMREVWIVMSPIECNWSSAGIATCIVGILLIPSSLSRNGIAFEKRPLQKVQTSHKKDQGEWDKRLITLAVVSAQSR